MGLKWLAFLNGHLYLIRATSHMTLRAHDHYSASSLIGGNGGAGPSSLHTILEAPTE